MARVALGALAVVAYLAACWALMQYAPNAPWAVAVLFGPWLLPLLGAAWRLRQPVLFAAAGAGGLALLWVVAHGGLGDVKRLYVAQHMLIHLALGAIFGWTLRPGAVPMITLFARRAHKVLTAPLEAYTRRLTAAWTLYFVAMAALSLVVFVGLPWSAWALLGNVLTPLSLVAMFVGEYWLRYRWHPEFERISLRTMVQASRGTAPLHGDAATPPVAAP